MPVAYRLDSTYNSAIFARLPAKPVLAERRGPVGVVGRGERDPETLRGVQGGLAEVVRKGEPDAGKVRLRMKRCDLILVVPCYNEADRLQEAAFLEFVRRRDDARLLFVDDGSTDDTAGVLARLTAAAPGAIGVLRLERNQGKAEAVRRGIVEALALEPSLVGFWDADLATRSERGRGLPGTRGEAPGDRSRHRVARAPDGARHPEKGRGGTTWAGCSPRRRP